MNEILQKRIEEAAENHEQHYNIGEEYGYLYTHKGDIKEAVIYGATFALQNQWISVEEALPPTHKMVMVCREIRIQVFDPIQTHDIGMLEGTNPSDRWRLESQKYLSFPTTPTLSSGIVTHWCSLPKLPEKKGGEE